MKRRPISCFSSGTPRRARCPPRASRQASPQLPQGSVSDPLGLLQAPQFRATTSLARRVLNLPKPAGFEACPACFSASNTAATMEGRYIIPVEPANDGGEVVVVEVQQEGSHPLDVRLVGCEGESPYVTQSKIVSKLRSFPSLTRISSQTSQYCKIEAQIQRHRP